MRFLIAGFVGSLGALVTGTIIAIIMQPYVAPHFGEYVRTEQDGLVFPSLLAGYAVIGFAISYIASKLSVESMSLIEVLTIGAAIGLAVFLGDHLVTAGWSYLPVGVMAVSGALDSLSIVVAFWAVSVVYRWKKTGASK